jgi:hypothetical protein
MKVQVYSNFSKNKIWKKIKSPISMRNGRFNTSSVGANFKILERKLSKGFSQDSLFLLPTFLG